MSESHANVRDPPVPFSIHRIRKLARARLPDNTPAVSLAELPIAIDAENLAAFCRRWSIIRLEVFGSALREDFRPDSDMDLLATYAPQAHWSLLDRARMKHELEDMLGRNVDLLNRRALERGRGNGRATAILAEAQVLYAQS